jgi:hypothetical protein
MCTPWLEKKKKVTRTTDNSVSLPADTYLVEAFRQTLRELVDKIRLPGWLCALVTLQKRELRILQRSEPLCVSLSPCLKTRLAQS